jgi:murein DD-endopeptidase MepM/ murein hydrolase activator NlpD
VSASRVGRRFRRLGALAIAALTAGLIIGALLGLLAGLLVALGAPAAAQPVAPVGAFGWPLRPGPPAVLTPFRAPLHQYGPGHRGVDLAGSVGQPVLAAGDGVVLFADVLAGRGVVSVEHPGGMRTTYEPVEPAVRPGQPVRRGEAVGRLAAGHPGCVPAVCLHWGLRRSVAQGVQYLDPLRLVRYRVRLLPSE